MKTATDSIAVIRTRMPYLDRRALSEAWFSALHLAREGRLAVPQRRSGEAGHVPPAGTRAPRAAALAAPVAASPQPRLAVAAAKRAVRDVTLERIASTEARPRVRRARPVPGAAAVPPPLDTSFRLTIGGARVRMLVRRDGPTLRITAICAASHVDTVRRALASADVAMRLRGHLVESDVRALGDRENPA